MIYITNKAIKIDTGIPDPTMSEDLIPRASIVTNITNIVAIRILPCRELTFFLIISRSSKT